MHVMRLVSGRVAVTVRVQCLKGRWIASADTSSGPTLGLGRFPLEAVADALEPFDDLADELLDAVPEELYYWR